MHILITGGTGFIGSKLCEHYVELGHRITALTRNPEKKYNLPTSVKLISDLKEGSEAFDVIINLAGEPLFKKRWNAEFKKIIHDSRIQTTEKIIDYIKSAKIKPQLLISGSAVGFYGDSPDTVFTENSKQENGGFSHQLCQDWEAAAMQATHYGVRVCISRTGIVLGKNGGALKQMLLPAKFGMNAILGSGEQWVSWIHIDDLIAAMDFLIHQPELNGPFNLTAPNPVSNKTLSKTLAKILHRPCFLRFPSPMVKMLFGEMGKALLLASQNVIPEKLSEAGYQFQYPDLEQALKELLASKQ